MFISGLILLFNSQMQWHLFSPFPFDLSLSNPSCFIFCSHFRDNAIYFPNFLLACVYLMHCVLFSDKFSRFYFYYIINNRLVGRF